jgi:hypothetical protein
VVAALRAKASFLTAIFTSDWWRSRRPFHLAVLSGRRLCEKSKTFVDEALSSASVWTLPVTLAVKTAPPYPPVTVHFQPPLFYLARVRINQSNLDRYNGKAFGTI